MTTTKTLDAGDLRQFTGSENWYRHALVRSVLYTDGAQYLAEHGGAYWLLDEIALAQRHNKRVAGEEFQFWKLAVNLDKHKAVLTCDDGNGNIVFSKRIPFTDFSLSGIKLYCTAWKRPRYKAKTRFLTTVGRARKGGLESGTGSLPRIPHWRVMWAGSGLRIAVLTSRISQNRAAVQGEGNGHIV